MADYKVNRTVVYNYSLFCACECLEEAYLFYDRRDKYVIIVPHSLIKSFMRSGEYDDINMYLLNAEMEEVAWLCLDDDVKEEYCDYQHFQYILDYQS